MSTSSSFHCNALLADDSDPADGYEEEGGEEGYDDEEKNVFAGITKQGASTSSSLFAPLRRLS